MDSGKLDRLITIQSASVAQNAYGEEILTWSTLATVWAQFLPGGGSERFTSQQVYAEAQARFIIRYRTDVTPENQIVYNGKTWDILSVDEYGGRGNGLEIKAKAQAKP
jgi:SPP1 family predicted phage head-tail adaptor